MKEPIIIERIFDAPVARVWQALTDSEQMKQWYFDIPNFKAEPGFEFSFSGGPEDRQYLHLCKVTEVIPNKKLVYSWRYDGYPGNSVVSFELFDEQGKTRLKLMHTGLETFVDHPDFARNNFVQGWTGFMDVELKKFLETKAQVPGT